MTINHQATAEKGLEILEKGDTIAQGLFIAASAQAHATIALVEQTAALVEQQRIANVIALALLECQSGTTVKSTYDEIFVVRPYETGAKYSVRPEFRKRLGL